MEVENTGNGKKKTFLSWLLERVDRGPWTPSGGGGAEKANL